MKEYLSLIQEILNNGEQKSDRTGTGTISIFGTQTKYDLREGFPLVTTKKTYFSSMLRELLWFIKGSTNINDNLNTKIWDAWADADGNLGPIYGYQWRFWEKYTQENGQTNKQHVDQLSNLISSLKNNPDSRRHIVSAWNAADLVWNRMCYFSISNYWSLAIVLPIVNALQNPNKFENYKKE